MEFEHELAQNKEQYEGATVFHIKQKGSDKPIKMMCLTDVKKMLEVKKLLEEKPLSDYIVRLDSNDGRKGYYIPSHLVKEHLNMLIACFDIEPELNHLHKPVKDKAKEIFGDKLVS